MPGFAGRPMVLETERLILRPFTEADLPAYARINATPAVVEYLGGMPLPRDVSDEQAMGATRSLAEHGFGKVAVERRSDHALLGMCGLSNEPWYPDDLEIGWRLAPEYWGHGYATEAARAWLAYGFSRLAAPRIISIADAPNVRSIAVMGRIGLRFDHAARLSDEQGEFDAVVYSIASGQRTVDESAVA